MNILKRTLAGLLIVFLAFGQVTSIPGTVDAVMGFSNLTTVGAIPYVSASGTLSQDSPGIHWDAAGDRLGLGTTSFYNSDTRLQVSSANNTSLVVAATTGGAQVRVYAGAIGLMGTLGSHGFRLRTNDADRISISSTGEVGIGPSNTSPSGTLHVYDATATTGVTTLTVRAGAGQSSTNLQQWMNAGGSNLAKVDASGYFFTPRIYLGPDTSKGYIQENATGGLYFRNAGSGAFAFSNGSITLDTGSLIFNTDLGLARASANNLGITNGASTTYATIGAGGLQMGTDNTYPIGASGSGRPSALFVAGAGTFGGNVSVGNSQLFYWATRATIGSPGDGIILLQNNAGSDFTSLRFGGSTSSFPALKRFGNAVAVRAADDTISTFATLTACSASGEGALASISDSATAVWGLVVTGGGSNHILAYCNGTNWTVAAK